MLQPGANLEAVLAVVEVLVPEDDVAVGNVHAARGRFLLAEHVVVLPVLKPKIF